MDVFASPFEMVRRQRSKGRQVHLTGPVSTVDEKWKEKLRDAMERHDPPLDQKDLALKIGVSRAAITKLFKPGPQQIRYKDRIHQLFRWPSATQLDEIRTRIEVGLMHLSEADRDLVAAFVERLANKP